MIYLDNAATTKMFEEGADVKAIFAVINETADWRLGIRRNTH